MTNPYQVILARFLKPLNVDVCFQQYMPRIGQLLVERKQNTILHLHWISDFYRGRHPWLRIIKFSFLLLSTRILGLKIVWTAHNIMPHRRTYPFLDIIGRFLITRLANAIIVHCEYAKMQLENKFRRKNRIYVIPHGSYIGMYSDDITRKQARTSLDVDKECFVYLSFGKMLAYKRIDYLVRSFIRMNDKNSRLFIAGQCPWDEQKRLKKICAGHAGIKLEFGFIPEEKVQIYFNAADVLVTPFSEILTSGSVILGLSFGLPIIAPAKGCLVDLIDSGTGILFDTNERNGLLNAMLSIQKKNIEDMGVRAYKLAETMSWLKIAHVTFDLYANLFDPA
jgi:glycosyltransferase involved in cell wall biosynthesis